MLENIILSFPDSVKALCSIFKENNFEIYAVGGVVRDMVMNALARTHHTKSSNTHLHEVDYSDIDFATNALPHEIISLFPKAIPTGIQHGTLTVLFSGNSYEVTTYRKDGDYKDFRHPTYVHFTTSLEEDLQRRDFTINAFACDPTDGKVIDKFNGIEDITHKLIRCVGNPYIRMHEDVLRIVRCIRFASTLGFEIEHYTYTAVQMFAEHIVHISKERICSELRKILCSSNPIQGVELLYHSTLLEHLLPSVMAEETDATHILPDIEHIFDIPLVGEKFRLGVHTHKVPLHSDIEILRLCILYSPRILPPEGIPMNRAHSYHHAHTVKNILMRLKFPNKVLLPVTHILARTHYCKIVKNDAFSLHKWKLKIQINDFKYSLLLSQLGRSTVHILLQYLQSFLTLSHRMDLNTQEYEQSISLLLAKLHDLDFLRRCISIKELDIDGNTLKKELKLSEGKTIGSILATLHRHVLRHPHDNRKKILLNLAQRYLKNRK